VIANSVESFALEARLLEKRVIEACSAPANATSEVKKDAFLESQSQWKRAMLAYHTVDSYPVGPLWADDRELSSQLYAWPIFNPCGIDAETVKVSEGLATAGALLAVPIRGLGALEYLLFEPTFETRCNARAYPQVAAWTAKREAQKKYDRCRYAVTVSGDVSNRAQILLDEWNPKGRNFTRSFIDGSNAAMKTPKDATNVVTDALFQIETVKDVRLGRPLGRHRDCVSTSGKCPESAEHPYSGLALRSIETRLAAFESAFFGSFDGTDGFGFDDLLKSRGHGEIADRLRTVISETRKAARGVDSSAIATSSAAGLQSLISAMDTQACAETTRTDRKVEVCGLFQDVRAVATILNAEVLSVLALRAPATYQGDND
jgi:predicted lipoprotein